MLVRLGRATTTTTTTTTTTVSAAAAAAAATAATAATCHIGTNINTLAKRPINLAVFKQPVRHLQIDEATHFSVSRKLHTAL
jgi:hypothetical protein